MPPIAFCLCPQSPDTRPCGKGTRVSSCGHANLTATVNVIPTVAGGLARAPVVGRLSRSGELAGHGGEAEAVRTQGMIVRLTVEVSAAKWRSASTSEFQLRAHPTSTPRVCRSHAGGGARVSRSPTTQRPSKPLCKGPPVRHQPTVSSYMLGAISIEARRGYTEAAVDGYGSPRLGAVAVRNSKVWTSAADRVAAPAKESNS